MKRILPLMVILAAVALLVPVAASADTVTTLPSWDGSSSISDYGLNGSTPTYGQTVTGDGQTLQSFTFYIEAPSEDVTARGGVGVWDGSEVTSLLWLGGDFTTVPAGAGFVAVTFTPNVVLDDGVQYVLFATALGDGGGGYSDWGMVWSGDSYPDGGFVYTNNYADTYLSDQWDGLGYTEDLAFAMDLGSGSGSGSSSSPGQGNHSGYCSVAGNTDANGASLPAGTFLDLSAGQPNGDPHFKGATPAFYYEGVGISCAHLPGFTATSELVGYGGHGTSGNYPYFTKNK